MLGRELEEARVLELMATGMPIRSHMALLDEVAADRLVDAFIECYRLERGTLARPFPGTLELVGGIRDAGISVAVVTSKLRADALPELAATGFLDMVDALVAFEDTKAHKPDAAPQRAALRAVDAAAGIGVGDLPSDITSARAAGLAAIGVAWGYGTTGSLLAAGAACVCETAEQLERELRERLAF